MPQLDYFLPPLFLRLNLAGKWDRQEPRGGKPLRCTEVVWLLYLPHPLERFHGALDEHLAAIGPDLAALEDRTLAAVLRGAFGRQVGAGTGDLADQGLDAGAAGFHLHAVVGVEFELVGGDGDMPLRRSACSSIKNDGEWGQEIKALGPQSWKEAGSWPGGRFLCRRR